MIKWNCFFGKNVQKFCVSFIEQNIEELKEQKVDKVASDIDEDVSEDVLVTNEEKEEKQEKEEEMETCATNRSFNKRRDCRHIRLLKRSLTCKICKLVRNILVYSGECKSD